MTLTAKPLSDRVKEILNTTKLTDPVDVSQELISHMTEAEKDEALIQVLPQWVSGRMSRLSALATQHDEVFEPKVQSIKKPGKSWHLAKFPWDSTRLSSGNPGEWVFWPDFTLEMAERKIAVLSTRVETIQKTTEKYELIKNTLAKHKVQKVGQLPAKAKAVLEAKLEALPTD